METMYDVRKLLKKYGIFVYTGNRIGDIEIMEFEIRDLYDSNIIHITEYQTAMLILKSEKANFKKYEV